MTCSKSHSLNSKNSNPGLNYPQCHLHKGDLTLLGKDPRKAQDGRDGRVIAQGQISLPGVQRKGRSGEDASISQCQALPTSHQQTYPPYHLLSPWVAEIPHQHPPIPSLSQAEKVKTNSPKGRLSVGDCCCFLTQTSGNSSPGCQERKRRIDLETK